MAQGIDSRIVLIRRGVPTRFEVPPFTDTIIRGFGLDLDGEFIQREWTPGQIEAWRTTREKWQRFERRTRWLRRLPLRLPLYTHDGWDEDGNDLGRSWKLLRVGPAISAKMEPRRPGPRQSIDLSDCMADYFEIVGTEGLIARNLLSVGTGRPQTLNIGLPA